MKGYIEVTTTTNLRRMIDALEVMEISELPPTTKSSTAIAVRYGETVYCKEPYETVCSKLRKARRESKENQVDDY